MSKPKNPTLVIPPDAYPQMVSKANAAAMARSLRSNVTAVTATRVIDDNSEALRDAVRNYVAELEEAGKDFLLVSEKAHEIRGFAETAGMLSTGRVRRQRSICPCVVQFNCAAPRKGHSGM